MKDKNLAKKAHRLAVALNPNADYQSDWPDIARAKLSQKTVAINVIDCIRKLDGVYNATSLGAIINHLPKFHAALSQLLATMQAQVLTYRSMPFPPTWRKHQPAPLQPIFPKTMPTSHESITLYQIVNIMKRLNTSADLCLDFAPSLFAPIQAIHTGLGKLLTLPSVRPKWEDTLPKFTACLLDTLATVVPAKFFTPAPYTPEWRRQQREQYHKQRGNKPNETSAKRKSNRTI